MCFIPALTYASLLSPSLDSIHLCFKSCKRLHFAVSEQLFPRSMVKSTCTGFIAQNRAEKMLVCFPTPLEDPVSGARSVARQEQISKAPKSPV